MKVETFFEFIEDMYGKYSESWKAWITKYLKTWYESDIDDLFHYLILRHKFNFPPNLAAIEEARREFSERYDKSIGVDWYTYRTDIRRAAKKRAALDQNIERSDDVEANKYFDDIRKRLSNGD
jgi:hypothetical protein